MIWEVFPLFGLFEIVLEGMVPAPLWCLVEFGCEPVWTWTFFSVGRLLIAASTSGLVIGLFRVLTSYWVRLGRVQVSRNLSIFSRFTGLCA